MTSIIRIWLQDHPGAIQLLPQRAVCPTVQEVSSASVRCSREERPDTILLPPPSLDIGEKIEPHAVPLDDASHEHGGSP